MQTSKSLIFSAFLVIFTASVFAQSRFGGGVVAGLNAAQILGDKAAGYNYIGLNVGARATVRLNETGNFLLSTELLYSQRGAKSTLRDPTPLRSATLGYLEIPVMISFLDWLKAGKNDQIYYKIHFTAGLSLGNLFQAKLSDSFKATHLDLTTAQLNRRDFAFLLGLSYYVNPHWGFTWRYTRSINDLFNPKKYKDDPKLNNLDALKGYFLTFQTVWMF